LFPIEILLEDQEYIVKRAKGLSLHKAWSSFLGGKQKMIPDMSLFESSFFACKFLVFFHGIEVEATHPEEQLQWVLKMMTRLKLVVKEMFELL